MPPMRNARLSTKSSSNSFSSTIEGRPASNGACTIQVAEACPTKPWRNRKRPPSPKLRRTGWRRGKHEPYRRWMPDHVAAALYFSCLFLPFISSNAQDIPTGFALNRYQKLWERNPFTLPTHAAAQAQPTLFDKLVLVSWLKEGKNDVVFVQNTETNEVQKITREPNSNNLKLLELRPNQNPKFAEAVLSNGTDQGPVKFKMEAPNPEQAAATAGLPPGAAATAGLPPGMQVVPPQNQNQRIPQIPGQAQNPLLQSLAGQTPGQQVQPSPGVPSSPAQTRPPRAQEYRRKRVLPPQPQQMPVNPQNGNQAINPRQTQE